VHTGVYSAASGALAAQQRLDAISNNLANVNTPGFKAHLLVQQAAKTKHAQNDQKAGHQINRTDLDTDFSQGQIEKTGDPLHLALSGDGFFVTAGKGGERLTRRGSFALDADGYLSAGDGRRVQGERGDISLESALQGGGPIEVSLDGTVRVAGARVDRVRVVSVADPQAMQRDGQAGFLAGADAADEAEPGTFEVRQASLERSNVSPIEGLVSLVEATRGFEAYMTAANRLDDVMSRAVNDVARV
jgi:flagellar basal-body rod protein FlgF